MLELAKQCLLRFLFALASCQLLRYFIEVVLLCSQHDRQGLKYFIVWVTTNKKYEQKSDLSHCDKRHIKVLHLWCMGLWYLFHTEPLPWHLSLICLRKCLSEMEQFACGDIDATCEDVPPHSVGYASLINNALANVMFHPMDLAARYLSDLILECDHICQFASQGISFHDALRPDTWLH